jgi:hypothetical protein
MGASGTGYPLLPVGYVGGTVTISAGQAGAPLNLLALIQAQLDANCPGSGQEINIQTDASGPLYIGRNNLFGPLSATNYGYQLPAGGFSRTYRSGFPGASSPVGDLWVFMAGAGTFHVEVHSG